MICSCCNRSYKSRYDYLNSNTERLCFDCLNADIDVVEVDIKLDGYTTKIIDRKYNSLYS